MKDIYIWDSQVFGSLESASEAAYLNYGSGYNKSMEFPVCTKYIVHDDLSVVFAGEWDLLDLTPERVVEWSGEQSRIFTLPNGEPITLRIGQRIRAVHPQYENGERKTREGFITWLDTDYAPNYSGVVAETDIGWSIRLKEFVEADPRQCRTELLGDRTEITECVGAPAVHGATVPDGVVVPI